MATLHAFIFNFSKNTISVLIIRCQSKMGRRVKSPDGSLLQETVCTADCGGQAGIQNTRPNSICHFCWLWKTLGSHCPIQGRQQAASGMVLWGPSFCQSVSWISFHACWGSRPARPVAGRACPALPSPSSFLSVGERSLNVLSPIPSEANTRLWGEAESLYFLGSS